MSTMSYYNVKVTLKIENEKGQMKNKSELYLVEAVSVTDAEAKIYKDFENYKGDWEVTAIIQTKVVKII